MVARKGRPQTQTVPAAPATTRRPSVSRRPAPPPMDEEEYEEEEETEDYVEEEEEEAPPVRRIPGKEGERSFGVGGKKMAAAGPTGPCPEFDSQGVLSLTIQGEQVPIIDVLVDMGFYPGYWNENGTLDSLNQALRQYFPTLPVAPLATLLSIGSKVNQIETSMKGVGTSVPKLLRGSLAIFLPGKKAKGLLQPLMVAEDHTGLLAVIGGRNRIQALWYMCIAGTSTLSQAWEVAKHVMLPYVPTTMNPRVHLDLVVAANSSRRMTPAEKVVMTAGVSQEKEKPTRTDVLMSAKRDIFNGIRQYCQSNDLAFPAEMTKAYYTVAGSLFGALLGSAKADHQALRQEVIDAIISDAEDFLKKTRKVQANTALMFSRGLAKVLFLGNNKVWFTTKEGELSSGYTNTLVPNLELLGLKFSKTGPWSKSLESCYAACKEAGFVFDAGKFKAPEKESVESYVEEIEEEEEELPLEQPKAQARRRRPTR